MLRRDGEVRSYTQRCRCDSEIGESNEWAEGISQRCELCRFCAIEPIRAGSRWSVFYCDDCRPRVVEVNRRFQRWVLPIGRHSMMYGVGLDPDSDGVERFTGELLGLVAAIKHLEEWTRERVAGNVRLLSTAELLQYDGSTRIDLAHTSVPPARVAPARRTGRLSHRNVQQRGFEAARDKAGLPKTLRFHDMRHAFASLAAHRGVPVNVLSAVMGHSNIGVTQNTYIHLYGREQAEDAFRTAMAGVPSPS